MRPGLSRPPRDLTNPEFQAQMSDEQLRQSIRIGKGQMPAFGGLMGDEEITNVIAYVRSLVPPGTRLQGSGGSPGAGPAAAAPSGAASSPPGVASAPSAPAFPAGAPQSGTDLGTAGTGSGAEPAAITARGVSAP